MLQSRRPDLCTTARLSRRLGGAVVDTSASPVAVQEKVPVVPITINGAGYVMPNKREGEMWAGRVVLTIHPPLLGGTDQELW